MNSVQLIGNLCDDPTLSQTQNGHKVCKINIAVKRPIPSANGQEVDFLSLSVWNAQAEYLCKYAYKGTKVGVVGRLEINTYTTKDNETRKKLEVIVERIEVVSGGVGSNNPNTPNKVSDLQEVEEKDLPF